MVRRIENMEIVEIYLKRKRYNLFNRNQVIWKREVLMNRNRDRTENCAFQKHLSANQSRGGLSLVFPNLKTIEIKFGLRRNCQLPFNILMGLTKTKH